jgi:hypothetical protein
VHISIFGNALLDPENTKSQVFAETRTPDTPTDQKNISRPKIYSKAMPVQKYISKV